jgi:hypothetical protein
MNHRQKKRQMQSQKHRQMQSQKHRQKQRQKAGVAMKQLHRELL